jgi:cytochrome P450
MLRNPDVYEDPSKFNPDRYETEEDMQIIQDMNFGFGRRVCPGRYFAFGTLMAIIPTILATCNVETGTDENGEEIPLPELELTSGTIMYALWFPGTDGMI